MTDRDFRPGWAAGLLVIAGVIAWPALAGRAASNGVESRLYVANDAEHRIDVFDVDRGHTLHHSITPRLNGRDLLDSRCRGIAAHAATRRLFFTDSDQSNVVAIDLSTEKVVWERRLEKTVLYVHDVSPLPSGAPTHVATVPLFSDISQPYYRAAKDIKGAGDGYWRWLTFSSDGRWAYPANGAVVDAERRRLTTMTITASEKQLAVGFRDGVPMVVAGQNGGVYRVPKPEAR